MISSADVIAQARVVYEQMQADALARSPLGAMADWVATGQPPPAAVLRAAGFTSFGAANADDLRLARKAFVRDWGFSIPCAEAVEALRPLAPWVEIGAGSGYWSALLQAAGVDIAPTDAQPTGPIGYGFTLGRHRRLEALDAVAAVQAYRDRNVFCAFPSEEQAWPAEAAAQIAPGRVLALIGDGRGGVTATAALFDVLDADFTLMGEVELPQFPRVNDRLSLFRRKSP
jgi:hypothetical protein